MLEFFLLGKINTSRILPDLRYNAWSPISTNLCAFYHVQILEMGSLPTTTWKTVFTCDILWCSTTHAFPPLQQLMVEATFHPVYGAKDSLHTAGEAQSVEALK